MRIVSILTVSFTLFPIRAQQDCEDVSGHICPYSVDYCNEQNFADLMLEICQKSCQKCSTPIDEDADKSLIFLKLVSLLDILVQKGIIKAGEMGGIMANTTKQRPIIIVYRPRATNKSCEDKIGSNGVSDCSRNGNLCSDRYYKDLMKEQCPKTCGYCDGTNPAVRTASAPQQQVYACEDLKVNGRSDCSSNIRLCQDPRYQQLMRQQCPRSCGYCGGSGSYYPYFDRFYSGLYTYRNYGK